MAGKNIEIEGLDEVVTSLENFHIVVKQVSQRYFKRWSDFGVKAVQVKTLNAGAVDTNEFIQGIHYEVSASGNQYTIKPSTKADKYALPLEEGSRPHFPPLKALEGWAERHNIPVFLVARKIAREGTKGRFMWRDGFADLQDKVAGEFSDYGDDIVESF